MFGQSSGNSAFGSNNSGSIFGQSNNSNNNNSNLASVFGQNNNNNSSSAFGSNTGGSGFSFNSSASGNTFGSSNPSSSIFGQNSTNTSNNNTSSFGGFGSGMNNNNTSPGFGSSFGAGSLTQPVQGSTIPFDEYTEKDPGTNGGMILLRFQSLSAMPQYQKLSLEEIRHEDYKQNRRYGNGSTISSGFGSAFGSNNNTSNSAFGSTGFGASNNTSGSFGQTPSAFGSNNTSNNSFGSGTGAFGSSNNSSPFGSNNNNNNSNTSNAFGSSFGTNNNSSPFGQNNTANKPLFGGSNAFGSNNTSNTGGMFGNNNNTNNTSSIFGQSNNSSTFGSNSNTNNNVGTGFGGGFGANKFGSNTTSSFGQNNNTGSSLFGQNNNNTASTGTGMFGNNNANNTTSGSLFGQNNNNNNTSTGGIFGNKPLAATGGLFGNNNASNNSGTGMFGGNSTNNAFGLNNNASATTGSLFGQKPAAATGGLFGNNNNNTNAATTGTSLFGNNNSNTSTGGMFGAKPAATATTGFGSTNTGGLFGGNNNTTNTTTTNGGLFGTNNGAKTLFGGNTNTSTITNTGGTGLFGAALGTNNNQQQQQTSSFGNGLFGQNQIGNNNNNVVQPQSNAMVASVDQNPYGLNPLFSSEFTAVINTTPAPVPVAIPLTGSARPKKHALLSVSKLAPKPLFSLGRRTAPKAAVSTPSSKLLTGNSSNSSTSPNGKSVGGANSINGVTSGSLYGSSADDVLLASHAFSPQKSVRRLILERKRATSQLYEDGYDEESDVLSENTAEEIEAVEDGEESDVSKSEVISNGVAALPAKVNGTKLMSANGTCEPGSTGSSPTVIEPSSAETQTDGKDKPTTALSAADEEDANEDGYWMSPRAVDLEKLSLHELRAVKNFVVGRRGVGKIEFLDSVDLSKFKNLAEDIFGRIVVFSPRSCSLYGGGSARTGTGEKPASNTGLNVRTRVSIEGVWPLSRATREPIKDLSATASAKHIAKLTSVLGGTFVSFDKKTGTFIFENEPLK